MKQWLEQALGRRDNPGAGAVLVWAPKVLAIVLFVLSYAKLVTGSFNPFIYFRF